MAEEQETTTQTTPEETTGSTEGTGGSTDERGGADGKAKALGFHGVGDYGRPSRRADAEEGEKGGSQGSGT